MANNQKNILCLVGGLLLGSGGSFLLLHYFRKKCARPITVIEYVFFDHSGKPFTITDREMYDIKHQYEDGVLVSSIAQTHGIDATMICRIINYMKWL